MATIVKRNNHYSVVYRYLDESTGKEKQKWESYQTKQAAEKRKVELENQLLNHSFIPPQDETVREFLNDWVNTYGVKKWGVSMYDSQTAMIRNYINPIIGDLKVQDINHRVIDKYIQTLQKTPAVSTRCHKAKTQYVTVSTMEKIIKLLRCAFNQAVRYEIIAKNPFAYAVLPRTEYKKRDIWTAEMIRTALDNCNDKLLEICIHLSFACSCRLAEILGLKWKHVHISDDDIMSDNAHIEIVQELERVSIAAMEAIGSADIYYVFDSVLSGSATKLVLKKPKTQSSIRKIWLPKTVAFILRDWKKTQDSVREYLGDQFYDFDLVVAQPNGRPCDSRIIEKRFMKLREKAGLPHVVFHSLRHSSTTYKLKLNHGDIKATQGDTGHAQVSMITEVYSHILDEDRKVNAIEFDSAFYSKAKENYSDEMAAINLSALLTQLKQNPELAKSLSMLISSTSSVSNQ